jgi:hypothetical protein
VVEQLGRARVLGPAGDRFPAGAAVHGEDVAGRQQHRVQVPARDVHRLDLAEGGLLAGEVEDLRVARRGRAAHVQVSRSRNRAWVS